MAQLEPQSDALANTAGGPAGPLEGAGIQGAPKRTVFDPGQIKKVAGALRALPPKPKPSRGITLMTAVRMLQKEIKALKARGYTPEDIAAKLREQGIPITTSTLVNYLTAANKPNGGGGGGARTDDLDGRGDESKVTTSTDVDDGS